MHMNILIACEESQAICTEMRSLGHTAFSCDIIECSGGHPEWHIMSDCIPILNGKCTFKTMDGTEHNIDKEWDMIIAHPPCTYLTISANKYYSIEQYGDKAIQRMALREEAKDFFMQFIHANCERIAVENPVGVMSTYYRKPDCIVSPHMFGDPVSKKTCFWLKGLPKLEPTNIVDVKRIHSSGKSGGYSGPLWYATDENGNILSWNDPRTAKIRSKTYPGIAKAIAEQWAGNAN